MANFLKHTGRTWLFLPLLFLLFSCASYNRQIGDYYSEVVNNNYSKADGSIDNIKKLQTSRNRLLYLLEKGKMAHLLKQYESSNRYFNEADIFMEDARTTAKDIALGTVLNPMMQNYKGEDFEKFMVHYYKALNYSYLGQAQEALVEARRISLQSYTQQEKTRGYSDDAFSLMLQGILYEQSGDINNAFISYRNAADIYLKNNNVYYGITMPGQLKKDVLRTAAINGFADQVTRYEELFGSGYEEEEKSPGGELVLFWENGLAPIKREQHFFLTLTKDGRGDLVFADAAGSFIIPFHSGTRVNSKDIKLEDFRSFHLAFPAYEEQPLNFSSGVVTVNNMRYPLEEAENINALAFATLKERFLKEASLALSRMVVKKLAEQAVRPDKDDKNKNEREAMAMALQVFNFASEKADTRNWQTLPHTIQYTRVPLQKGMNHIRLELSSAYEASETVELNVEGNGGVQVRNVCTLK